MAKSSFAPVFLLLIICGKPVLGDINEGLVGYWSFDEGSGSVVHDASGNDNDGAINGASWDDGISGKALSFDGVDDYVRASANGLPTSERTVSLWFYTDIVTNKPNLIGYGGGGPGTSFLVGINHWGQPVFSVTCHYGVNTLTYYYPEAPINQWFHYIVTTSAEGTKIYINGVEKESNNKYINNTYVSNKDLAIATCVDPSGYAPFRDGNVGSFRGVIDEVRIYNRVLSDDEIKCLYEDPSGGMCSNTACNTLWNIKWFRCDAGDDNVYDLQRDGTPICGSSNCPTVPCWGVPVTERIHDTGGIGWSTTLLGGLSVQIDPNMNAYGDTYLYVYEPNECLVTIEHNEIPFNMWLNDSEVYITPEAISTVSLPLVSGWNHLEWTCYHQHSGASFSIDYPFATYVDCMSSRRPECSNEVDDDGDGLIDYAADLGCIGDLDISELTGDFDNDWDVDLNDLFILASFWLQNEPMVDIAPLPVGDDTTDLQDFGVMSGNWLEGIEY